MSPDGSNCVVSVCAVTAVLFARMTSPAPTFTDPDGSATWETRTLDITAVPAHAVNPATVVVNGHTLSPRETRGLASVLLAAADYAEQ